MNLKIGNITDGSKFNQTTQIIPGYGWRKLWPPFPTPATDLGMGQPLEFALSSCVLAVRLGEPGLER
ncbi:MAG: hypothetical protein U0401_25775 [Anaerolineae bacterium]